MAERSNIPLAEEKAAQAAERIYHKWDAALGAKDLDAVMALYAPDCVLESPLVRHLLGAELGIVEGREKLREFVRLLNIDVVGLQQADHQNQSGSVATTSQSAA